MELALYRGSVIGPVDITGGIVLLRPISFCGGGSWPCIPYST